MPATEEIQSIEPLTVAEKLDSIRKDDKDAQVFLLYQSGVGSKIVGVGKTYEDMWKHAASLTGIEKADLVKHGYVFDVATARDAKRLI